MTGTFVRSVDDKLRIALPKRLREALGGTPALELFVTPGTDTSLAIYTGEALAALAQRMAAASPAQHDVRAFNRLFYARAERIEVDGQGRIRIPPPLATLSGLEKEAVLLGVLDHLELWDRGRWETYLADKSSQFDQIAENAFGAGQ
ncbi:MAG TPA: division/cell wall cluster transcriptional repressor MraZ [Pirellulales bacterium]|nr:division/cell wall cluster transcriptional repressor MraZ [Pirellulales bacterium]HEV3024814.1 division/cell wall cluster transcriptional repressor MraZ [Pirellulales bacterium]